MCLLRMFIRTLINFGRSLNRCSKILGQSYKLLAVFARRLGWFYLSIQPCKDRVQVNVIRGRWLILRCVVF